MAREIKFRGKGKYGVWYLGYYVKEISINDSESHFIITEDGLRYLVDSHTIGQYTGLKDKNGEGKDVYEGDLIRCFPNGNEPRGIYEVYWDEEELRWLMRGKEGFKTMIFRQDYEAIGNIYENPYHGKKVKTQKNNLP